ncbi:DUF2182 domain-containing protein [Mesorhizobium sp. A556]
MSLLRDSIRSGRAAVWTGMAAIVALGWLYMLRMNAGMSAMHGMAMPAAAGLAALLIVFAMWAVMMAAMMLPSAVPAVSVFMMLAGRRGVSASGRLTAMFVVGYALAWLGFCVPAALAQWGLSRTALLTPMGESTSTAINAAILVAAGLFQFSALKSACISKCRTPFAFLMHEWRDGAAGALVVGLRYGMYCVGCCWALMAVMFVVGTMNLIWMALLATLVLSEKIMPARWRFDWVVGAGLILWGGALATASYI